MLPCFPFATILCIICYYLYTASRKQPPIVDNNNIIETEEVEEKKKKERETIKSIVVQQEHTFSPSYVSCRSASFLHLTQIYSSLITTKMSQFLQDGGKECDGQTTVIVHFLDNSSKTVLADEQTTVEEALEELFGRLLISKIRE